MDGVGCWNEFEYLFTLAALQSLLLNSRDVSGATGQYLLQNAQVLQKHHSTLSSLKQ